ncbi:MAG: metal ABC transporter ATP-binding protein [Planctomycetota bacterium]|nr:MAG: metal ABC transporter ATP-binding protein [Planctomycetota bacterium]
MEAAIELLNLTVSYHHKPALRGVSLKIPKGKITTIMGPNGAGKSTLLKAIIGLESLDTGEVRILGESQQKGKKWIAYLPQKEMIDWDFPMVVEDVVMMGRYPFLGPFRRIRHEDRIKVREALEKVNMWDFHNRHIRFLSGGQQQKVFIARALVQEAEILFMDEPFVGVDAKTQNVLLELIKGLKDEGKTVVVINHDFQILDHFDYLVFLNKQVIAAGPVEEVHNERNYSLAYGGRMPLVEKAEQRIWRAKKQWGQ